MIETWKDIPGFERCYQASDLGRVRSLDRIVFSQRRTSMRRAGAVLKPATNHDGHQSVALGRNVRNKYVHALVMLTFVGPYPPGMEILHRNSDPSDNRLVNLVYGTRAENVAMDFKLGKRNAKAVRICIDGKDMVFESGAAAARHLGCTTNLVNACALGGFRLLRKYRVRYAESVPETAGA